MPAPLALRGTALHGPVLRAAIHRALADARTAARSSTRRERLRESTLQLLVVAVGVAQLGIGREVLQVTVAAAAGSTLLTCAVLLVRYMWPATALTAAALLMMTSTPVTWLCMPVVAFSAGRRLPQARLWAMAAVAATLTLSLTVVTDVGYGGESWWAVVAVWALFVLLMIVVPAGCGAVLGQRRPAGRLLRERNAHLERTRELTAARARRLERARIAGEMHDMLGHRLSLLSVHAGALELRTAQQAPIVSDQARLLRATAATALTELRQILQLTYGVAGDDAEAAAPAVGTRADLNALVERSREAGLNVSTAWSGDADGAVDPRTRQAMHRAVREGLTNVHKHAPTTPSVHVEVTVEGGRTRVTVTNAPPTTRTRGHGTKRGLVGLDERAALLGGTCRSRMSDDGGYVLTLDVPTAPDGMAPSPSSPRQDDIDVGEDGTLDEPPPLQEAQMISTRRMVALLTLAALLAVPAIMFALIVIVAVFDAVYP